MKEDILEQLVDDYLQSEGYFTRHNIKFRPRPDHPDFIPKKDSNHSDIDVIGIHPKKTGFDRVWVVSCKSWQSGFRVPSKLAELEKNKIINGREAWQSFRELVKPKWSEAFINSVEEATGTRVFTYVLAVTAIIGDRSLWQNHPLFIEAIGGNPIRLIELSEILDHLQKVSTTTVASSDIGRVLQLMRASQKGKKELLKVVESQNEIH
jgi:Nuclease-related domain